ncbi:TRAP transporter substrate-binding protein DctP [Mangrovicoccus sp. HB161399]|uniref:TRAP transporter substrate-binding protein DctP n=1 Tax=Mangrovicoccus sp. HB161399 TaxID=2720392 RepID=UPI0015572988|nr:TRAP transporter substrate-binding protein DctP [Mangrovicoccus sp. HB161399]
MSIATAFRATAAATALFAAASGPAAAGESFILAHAMNSEHVFHVLSENFIADLGGDFDVAYHPAGDLGDWTSIFEQTMQGVVPMSITWAASEFDPRLDLTWLGYVASDWESARAVYGPGSEMLRIYNDILSDLDLVAIGIVPADFGSIVIRKGVDARPTNFPEDGRGVKIRVPGVAIGVDRFANFGFSAVPIPLAEVYTALQLGTVDARAFSTAVESYNMRDVLDATILTNDYFDAAFWLVNKDWWEGLDAADRDELQAAADKEIGAAWGEAEAKSDEYLAKLEAEGVEVIRLDDAQMAKAKAIVYENEWPAMEEVVGPEIMAKLRKAAGIE